MKMGQKLLPPMPRRSPIGESVFAALEPFGICVHLCSSVVKVFFNRIVTAELARKIEELP
jgi:hypothetical protein